LAQFARMAVSEAVCPWHLCRRRTLAEEGLIGHSTLF
jgi:hypothetical protein